MDTPNSKFDLKLWETYSWGAIYPATDILTYEDKPRTFGMIFNLLHDTNVHFLDHCVHDQMDWHIDVQLICDTENYLILGITQYLSENSVASEYLYLFQRQEEIWNFVGQVPLQGIANESNLDFHLRQTALLLCLRYMEKEEFLCFRYREGEPLEQHLYIDICSSPIGYFIDIRPYSEYYALLVYKFLVSPDLKYLNVLPDF